LTELLTVPIQRVLKYHLLLEQLCKLTPVEHPERPGLIKAHEAMKELAQSINEVKRDLDTISAIDQIQSSLLHPEVFRFASVGAAVRSSGSTVSHTRTHAVRPCEYL
uniref:DH domain-containing protein n=1 Tax=Echinostoma caproni TaxID=27848 RepID=A0A183B0P5_9TREM